VRSSSIASGSPNGGPAGWWTSTAEPRPRFCRKRRRLGPTLTGGSGRLGRIKLWAIDFQFDETADRRRLELANIVDEFTGEALAMRVGRSWNEDQLVEATD
jgi:hypothetical protein